LSVAGVRRSPTAAISFDAVSSAAWQVMCSRSFRA
jgi:hypothetical protein